MVVQSDASKPADTAQIAAAKAVLGQVTFSTANTGVELSILIHPFHFTYAGVRIPYEVTAKWRSVSPPHSSPPTSV
jgi:hypothetical protein